MYFVVVCSPVYPCYWDAPFSHAICASSNGIDGGLFISTNNWYHLVHPNSPCGCGDLSVQLGSRISPHRNRVVVDVHWRSAQGWRYISWVVATFSHVGGSFNLSMAATGDVWIIPFYRMWGYVLHVEHISCVITNCGQLQWAIPSLFSIAL